MNPCGQIKDMATGLTVQRLYLSDDPDDWVWIRWQLARAGAQCFDFMSIGGHPLWETDRGDARAGPRADLIPFEYRPDRTSPHPGDHHLGKREWWEDGLPLSARPAEDYGPGCIGEVWGGDLGVGVVPGGVEPNVVLAGGADCGGEDVIVFGPCPFFYGSCAHLRGGAGAGGSLGTHAGESMSVAGGAGAGGSLSAPAGEGGSLAGGSMAGGSMTMGPAPSVRSGAVTNAVATIHVNTKPAGVASGDLIVVVDVAYSAIVPVPSLPSGFTSLASGNTVNLGLPYRVSYKVAGGSEPASYPTAASTNVRRASLVTALRDFAGVPTAAVNDGNTNSVTWGSVTLTGMDGVVVLNFGCVPVTGNTLTDPSGATRLVSSGSNDGSVISWERKLIPGAVTVLPGSYGATAANWVTVLVGVDSPTT